MLPPAPRWQLYLILVASLSILAVGTFTLDVEGNPASRLATMESLVERGVWHIDDSVFRYDTVDKVYVAPHFYSSKPPVYPALGALAYGALHHGLGLSFREDRRSAVAAVRLLLHAVPFALGLLLSSALLRRRVANAEVWLWGTLAFAFGTLLYGYSATVNNHAAAALCTLVGLAALDRSVHRAARGGASWAGVGLCVGLAPVLDFGAIPFAGAVVLALIVVEKPRSIALFALGAAVPVVAHLVLTVQLTGSVLPFYRFPELYSYPGSYWHDPGEFDALTEPAWVYWFHALVGHHGLFAMTPLFVFAPFGIARLVRSRERRLGLVVGASTLLTLGVYLTVAPRNYGGMAQGMRWFIVLVPGLWYAAMRWCDAGWHRRWVRVAARLAIAVGAVHAVSCVFDPWSVSLWNRLMRTFGLGSLAPYNVLFGS